MFGINKKLGFGLMRLPGADDELNYDMICEMVDHFQSEGFNYYDTAHGYHGGKSEIAFKECVAKRYPRDSFLICNKLSVNFFEKQEDIRPLFEKQLEACGVEYFDIYLMHSQLREIYDKFRRCNAYEEALKLKNEGKFRHFGISFHDSPEMLEEILVDYPQIEVVQLQFNYIDYDDPSVQSRKCYDITRKYNKAVFVMEPVKGGSLVNLPDSARNIFTNGSYASYAIRFGASFEGVEAVLSGMGDLDMIKDIVLDGGKVNIAKSIFVECDKSILRFYKSQDKKAQDNRKTEPVLALMGENFFANKKIVLYNVNNKDNYCKKINNMLSYTLIDCDKISGEMLIRSRKEGDKITLAKRRVTKSLKKLFSEEKIPENERLSKVVISDDKGIVLVEGFGADKRVAPDDHTKNLLCIEIYPFE